MLLAIDVGNTNTNAGVFSKGKLIRGFVVRDNLRKHIKGIDRVIIVSVSPRRLNLLIEELRRVYRGKIFLVGKDIKIPLRSEYNPREIGRDRLVTAYAAARLYGRPVLIIDFGTAVTFDVVSKEHIYLGGLILPGLKMSIESLHKKTALLPEVQLKKTKGFIGKNTKDAIRNGMVYGYASVCEGMIKRFKKKFKNLKIIATGGNAELILSYTADIKKVDKNLSLKGLVFLDEKQ